MIKDLIDLHSHILPKIDDGARNIKRSVLMGKVAKNEGISTIVATPHYYEDDSNGMLTRRMERLTEVRQAFSESGVEIELLPGFEVSATRSLKDRRSLGALTLAGSLWILLERSYSLEEEFDDAFDAVLDAGFRPLIAHPERYDYFTDDIGNLAKLVDRGAWGQVTAASVAGFQGEESQQWCFEAFEKKLVHVVATDMHNMERRPPCMRLAAEIVEAKLGNEAMREIFCTNPLKILGRTVE